MRSLLLISLGSSITLTFPKYPAMLRFIPILLVVFSACASLSDQAKSRELLAKCEYELKDVKVENIDFNRIIRMANSAKEINYQNPGKDVLPLLKDIKDLKFDVDFTTLDLEALIAVNNPNMHPVILDSLVMDVFVDETLVTNVIHDGHTEIAPNSIGEMNFIFALPTDYKLKRLQEAEFINLRGRIWLKIELIKGLPFTIPFNVDVKQRVPREQLNELVKKQKQKMAEKIVKELTGGIF